MIEEKLEEKILEYTRLPKDLKKQLKRVSGFILNTNPYYRRELDQFMKKHFIQGNSKLRKTLSFCFILDMISPMQLLSNEMTMRATFCYDLNNRRINFIKPLKIGKHACVMLGYFENKDNSLELQDYAKDIFSSTHPEKDELVIKWYQSEKRDVTFESGIYKKLSEMGCPLPYFSTNFMYWNQPVLVIEKLEEIGFDDDEKLVGVHVIFQLFYIHKLGVHCDIKPQNIMKKRTKKETHYYLIDFGGLATEKFHDGYRRWLWSPKWSSQKPHKKNQIVYPKHDLIELAFTLNYIKTKGSDDFRNNFKGKLLRFVKYLRNMNNTPESKDYRNLIEILIKNKKK
jgi:hypothetical protein